MPSETDRANHEHRREMGILGALTQGQHAAINARWPGLTREHCFICEAETGRAGAGEDSIFDRDDAGPYCPDCCAAHPARFD